MIVKIGNKAEDGDVNLKLCCKMDATRHVVGIPEFKTGIRTEDEQESRKMVARKEARA